ncbi:MAG: DNA-binding response regulator [Chloroflexi bacterium HGW-Chloroflexi-10]|nr:MAG: DNA-binding response regulator [Chloroflexi bacterium HGW-Chloroflexi-10]
MITQPKLLVIDDEPQIQRALQTILKKHNYQVSIAATGEEGLTLAAIEKPDIIILDLGLPDINGIIVCERLREWTQTPIIVLSVRDSERDKVMALDKGADDYLVKPFSIEELLARVRVSMRHALHLQGHREPVYHFHGLDIDLSRYYVAKNGIEVKFTATEFKLLAFLVANAGRVLTHQTILKQVWGMEYMDNIEYLRVFISQLRKKIEENPKEPNFILSEPGIGYRFCIID